MKNTVILSAISLVFLTPILSLVYVLHLVSVEEARLEPTHTSIHSNINFNSADNAPLIKLYEELKKDKQNLIPERSIDKGNVDDKKNDLRSMITESEVTSI